MSRLRSYLFCLLVFCYIEAMSPFAVTNAFSEGGGAVLGRVFEFGDKSPVARATVIAHNEANGFEQTSVTAADGTFFIASLMPGFYTLSATREGFQGNSISGYPIRVSGSPIAESVQIRLARIGMGQILEKADPLPYQFSVPQADSGEGAPPLEIRVRWDLEAVAGLLNFPGSQQRNDIDRFSLIEKRQMQGPMPRQRMPELSSDQILVVIVDERGVQRGWTLIPDPSILRAESPGPNGELRGQILRRTDTEFLVPLPGGLLPAILDFYQPEWTGNSFSLNKLGTLALR